MMSDEFEIAEVPLAAGVLGLSPCPGRAGNYGQDLASLRAWAPDYVVTMVTQTELEVVSATELGRDLHPIVWRHLPVTDFGTLDAAGRVRWTGVSAELHGVLSAGGRVLVHCFGGCGRSGMIVLRLMVASGEPPDMALSRLRQARPCAVETQAQMDWAVAG